METRPNQYRPIPDLVGVAEPGQHQTGNNEVVFQSPQSPLSAQVDRKAVRADRKAAKRKEKEEEARAKREKAEQFRVTHKGTSLAKAHQEHDFDGSSRYIKLVRKGAKFTRTRPLFNPNSNT
jgi:hypothetical protein